MIRIGMCEWSLRGNQAGGRMAKEIIDVLVELRQKKVPHAVATVVEVIGSVSAKTGSKAVIDRDGFVVAGWVGGGCAESAVCQAGSDCIATGKTTVIDIDLNDKEIGRASCRERVCQSV